MGIGTPLRAKKERLYRGGAPLPESSCAPGGSCRAALATATAGASSLAWDDGRGSFQGFASGAASGRSAGFSGNHGLVGASKTRDRRSDQRLHPETENGGFSDYPLRQSGEFGGLSSLILTETAGESYQGYERFFDALLDQLLTPLPVVRKKVNLLGIVPYRHAFWKGDLLVLKNLLEGIGLDVNMIFNETDRLQALRRIPAAELNLVFSPWCGVSVAEKLEAKFGTPYTVISSVPVGPRDTSALLRFLARRLQLRRSRVEQFIDFQELHAHRFAECLADTVVGQPTRPRAAVVADAGTAIALARYGCNELAWEPKIVILTDDPPQEFRAEIVRSLTEGVESAVKPEVRFESDPGRIASLLREHSLQLVLSSSREKDLAVEELGAVQLSVAFPVKDRLIVDRSYAGYRGGLAFVEDLAYKFGEAL